MVLSSKPTAGPCPESILAQLPNLLFHRGSVFTGESVMTGHGFVITEF